MEMRLHIKLTTEELAQLLTAGVIPTSASQAAVASGFPEARNESRQEVTVVRRESSSMASKGAERKQGRDLDDDIPF